MIDCGEVGGALLEEGKRGPPIAGTTAGRRMLVSTGIICQREFPLRREGLGPLAKFIRQLDLNARYAVDFTSLFDAVNFPSNLPQ